MMSDKAGEGAIFLFLWVVGSCLLATGFAEMGWPWQFGALAGMLLIPVYFKLTD